MKVSQRRQNVTGAVKGEKGSPGKLRRLVVVGALVTGGVALGVTAALAGNGSVTTSGSTNISNTEASFSGQWIFYKAGVNNGGYGYPGTVCDNYNNSYASFVNAKTEGYGYGPKTYAAASGGCTSENLYVYDYQATYVNTGTTQVCVDRGSLLANKCSTASRTRA